MAQPDQFDFSAYIAEHTRDFTGRGWVFAEIDQWLADPNAPHCFLIIGAPGIGKTAIAARLTQVRDLAAVHFCIARQANTIDPLNFARSLSNQLTLIDGFAKEIFEEQGLHVDVRINVQENYGQIVGVQIENLIGRAGSAAIAFNRSVGNPLRLLYANGFDRQLVILVDALDEAVQQRGPESIVDLLANARGLPTQVRFVLTSRPEGAALRHFERLSIPHLVLHAGRDESLQDVREYSRCRLGASEALQTRLAEQEMQPQEFVERVTEASRGNFLYLVWLLPAVAEGTQRFDALDALPKGLDGIYREFLRTRKLGQDIRWWRERYRMLLGVLTVAQAPLRAEQLASFTGLDRQAARDALLDVQQFLDPRQVEQGRYQLYHQSVADFLGSEDQAQEFWIDATPIHQQIADYCLNTFGDSWASCDDVYSLQNLAKHLVGADRSQDLCLLVQDPGWYSSRSRQDPSRHGYASDLDLAFDATSHQGSRGWPCLAANCLIRATLAEVSRYLPIEVYETLVRIGRGQEALRRASTIPETVKRVEALTRISDTARQLNENGLVEQVQERLPGLSVEREVSQSERDDGWLIDFVDQFGARKALRSLLRGQTIPDPDRSKAVRRYIEVATAASALSRFEEANELLLECMDLVGAMSDHDRESALVQISRLLLDMGYEEDLNRAIDLTQGIELEHYRVCGLAELALICAEAPDHAVARRCLKIAVTEVETAARRSTLQFELSKISLAMSKLGDKRAEEFLEQAIELAARPTQPAWQWEEKGAWTSIGAALASTGLCDEALSLAEQKGTEGLSGDRIAVELALQGRWEDAWRLAEGFHPIAREHALVSLVRALAQCGKLQERQYKIVIAGLEESVESAKTPHERFERLGRLTYIALLGQDEHRAQEFLLEMVQTLAEIDPVQVEDAIRRLLRHAVRLRDVKTIQELAMQALTLSEDRRYESRSQAIAAVAVALADLGAIGEAWSLADAIGADWKRLETRVRICESAQQQGKTDDDYFRSALQFALQVDNNGWVPTSWGRLAVLAHQLGDEIEQKQCTQYAIDGVRSVSSSYETGFSVHNSVNLAQSLYQIGMSAEAQELLKYGLSRVQRTGFSIDSFHRLVQAVVRTGAESLWPDVLDVAQGMEDPQQKAEALLDATYGIAHLGDRDQAVGILPLVLAAVLDLDRNQRLPLEFGSLLTEIFAAENQSLDNLVIYAFTYARSKDRPTALTWVAALLPVFARVDPALVRETWHKIEQVEAICER